MTAQTSQARATIALDPGQGEALWFNNDLLTFKATGAQTGGAYLLLEEVARQGKMTPLHPPRGEGGLLHPRRAGADLPRR